MVKQKSTKIWFKLRDVQNNIKILQIITLTLPLFMFFLIIFTFVSFFPVYAALFMHFLTYIIIWLVFLVVLTVILWVRLELVRRDIDTIVENNKQILEDIDTK